MSDPSTPPILPANPGAEYRSLREPIREAIERVLDGGHYILGPEVEAFEEEFARYVGVEHGIGVGSGTDAIHLALRALDIGPGDTVITVSHTAVATVAAIELSVANACFADIDPGTFTMSPESLDSTIERAIRTGARVRAVIPVHLYGHPADMPAIMEISRRHHLAVIEDCAQSHGARLNGIMTGSWGDIGAFSFYPTKNLAALGDGGALVTNSDELAEKARPLRQYGWRERYISHDRGMNTRLDELQAAVLRVKLRTLEESSARRRELAGLYQSRLGNTSLVLPRLPVNGTHAFHQYVVRSERRDDLRTHLQKHGVITLIHYPVPVHMQPAYRDSMPESASLPATELAARQVLSLPLTPGLSDREVERVADLLAGW